LKDEDGEEKEYKDEEPVEHEESKDRKDNETDVQYWQRILGPAYHDHVVQTLREQEEVAKTLGKGKRIRKQINYAEREMMEASVEFNKVGFHSNSPCFYALEHFCRFLIDAFIFLS